MSILAGITMLGAARLAMGKSPRAKMADVQAGLDETIAALREQLTVAADGGKRCGVVERFARKGAELRTLGMSAAGDGAPTNAQFFMQIREIGQLMSLAERHCVRDRAVKRDALRAQLPQMTMGGFAGATKVCVEYKRYPSGKIRCAGWTSGPGYTPGPHEEEFYRIESVRDYYANALCSDPSNRKKCGLARKYRYRRTLPYLPREVAKRDAPLPDVPGIKKGVVRIIALGPARSLKRKRESAR